MSQSLTVCYPASHEFDKLTSQALALKIARHSECEICADCSGLRPPPGTATLLDTSRAVSSLVNLTQYGSDDDDDDDDDEVVEYLQTCACGHSCKEHGAGDHVGKDELTRRGRMAIRLDELLGDQDKLLDFDYSDDNIRSLRLQMVIPASASSPLSDSISSPEPPSPTKHPLSSASSALSDAPQPPTKRRRYSTPLSDADGDDKEDEDQPLASRIPTRHPPTPSSKTGQRAMKHRAGKKVSGTKSVAQGALPSQVVDNGRSNAQDMKVKLEDKMDEGQLTRLATGVTVDTGVSAPTPTMARPEKIANVELRQGVIQVTAVENDGQPRSLVILSGLKTLFQKQLPNMPREYITRLVFDANSKALAIIKWGYKVVGGICYRPFPQRRFAEIVFFATNSVDQVKGYGGMLMNHFKAHIRRTYPDMMHFLTYADNYAVGYFRKQGFSKEITLDRSVWAGYTKDYEGSTMMQCHMLPRVDYLRTQELIAAQREAIMRKIRQMSKSHIVHPGLPQFREGAPPGIMVDVHDVPGLRETGWTPSMQMDNQRNLIQNPQHNAMRNILSELQNNPLAWAFLQPVNGEEVRDYYSVIRSPMDFSTMEHKLETNQYQNVNAFVSDAQLVFRNCKMYNPEGSIYARNATKLEKVLKDLTDKLVLD